MGIVLKKKRVGETRYLTGNELKKWREENEELRQSYQKMPSKKKNGKSSDHGARITAYQKKIKNSIIYLDGNHAILETIPDIVGNGVSMPYAKFDLGYFSVDGFIRNKAIDLGMVGKLIGLNFNELMDRVRTMAKYASPLASENKEHWDLSQKIVRINKK